MRASEWFAGFSSAGSSGGFAPKEPSVNPNASAEDRGLTDRLPALPSEAELLGELLLNWTKP